MRDLGMSFWKTIEIAKEFHPKKSHEREIFLFAQFSRASNFSACHEAKREIYRLNVCEHLLRAASLMLAAKTSWKPKASFPTSTNFNCHRDSPDKQG